MNEDASMNDKRDILNGPYILQTNNSWKLSIYKYIAIFYINFETIQEKYSFLIVLTEKSHPIYYNILKFNNELYKKCLFKCNKAEKP